MSFKMLSLAVSDIFKDCISNSFTAAQGFGWARPGGMLSQLVCISLTRDIAG